MSALLLLLVDSRSPAGAHNHSAGMEPAVTTGLVRDLGDVETFCRRRLATSGRVAAHFAAAACTLAQSTVGPAAAQHAAAIVAVGPGQVGWAELDAEFDARTPSEAMRAASHQLGRGLLRLVRAMLPGFIPPWGTAPVHHPVLLGAAVAAAGGDPDFAARAAALGAVSVPASAAVRLLGLDPFAVQTMLARLAPDIDALATDSSHRSPRPDSPAESGHGDLREGPGRRLAADAALDLDLLADFHLTSEVRLFAS